MLKHKSKLILTVFLSVFLAGCTFVFQSGRRSDLTRIEDLSRQLDELANARNMLEQRLAGEIKDKQIKLQMVERGLVITYLADVLFDSGKAKIRTEAYSSLDKVADVLKEAVPDLNIGIEGHTDDQPIKYSGWKSNWELSTARALSVLHYLVDERGLLPDRVSAIGYGEYRPVTGNDSLEGRKLNRRVEIVVLPKVSKVKARQSQNIEPLEPGTAQKIK